MFSLLGNFAAKADIRALKRECRKTLKIGNSMTVAVTGTFEMSIANGKCIRVFDIIRYLVWRTIIQIPISAHFAYLHKL